MTLSPMGLSPELHPTARGTSAVRLERWPRSTSVTSSPIRPAGGVGWTARLVAKKRERDPLGALTERERAVLALMAQGRSNSGLSAELCLSAKTVEAHVRSIFTKLDLPPATIDHRRVLAVLAFLRS